MATYWRAPKREEKINSTQPTIDQGLGARYLAPIHEK
jgi:hypothetical protein